MEIDKIVDQAKSYADDKLKNPYFGSVIAVWLFTNRVLLFGLFNFDKTQTLEQKISWAYRQLQTFDYLDWMHVHGFTATVLWSLFWGYFTMVAFNKINGFGKAIFKWSNRGNVNLLRRIEPNKWIEMKKYNELEEKIVELETQIKSKKSDINRLEKENETTQILFSETKKQVQEKEELVTIKNKELKLREGQIEEFTAEANKFRVTYARYGKNENFKEVTKVISDTLNSRENFKVNNVLFGSDPFPFMVKDLVIQYEFERKPMTFIANEDEIVEFKDNVLTAKPTEESNQKQSWVLNQIKLSEFVSGDWSLTYTKNNKPVTEKVIIDNSGKYFVNGVHSFNLLVTFMDDKSINLMKVNLHGKKHSTEILKIHSDKLITGHDTLNYTLEYKKNDKQIDAGLAA